ncbi:polysaccharide pyruvyl transferase family protein [Murimonas intestini]|uniref:Polysaccharide pyruvyl transferase n=1 Tax=Murimonas intestini TaxID=1337051 RepID=A0AB73T4R9_9FIRM|nr:polysaccharide pyruvyl transferase family protein [Murimonas intestini]MCR1840682.1 polysaccharide pyruvyl transferase family protein [Murimonas intestini]MCR1865265.1 polysaccharide pyruvyl transferase family protein [Murimonas intestini]MCR1883029.1 polysaccharide pyruvyl transferase family protein [Murimonas intestini]
MTDDKSKVAVITEYYKSTNYGGNLQAYALARYITDNIAPAFQICYSRPSTSFRSKLKATNGIINKLLLIYSRVKDNHKVTNTIRKVIKNTFKQDKFRMIDARKRKVIAFGEENTPHTSGVYNDAQLHDYKSSITSKSSSELESFTTFITGSDQVWRTLEKKPYFLTFVPECKTKLSYAASVSKKELDIKEKAFFKKALVDFDSVSVREYTDVALIREVYGKDIKWVVDPVFLLQQEEWEKICSPRQVKEKYIFCYFLGDEVKPRKLAQEYAKRHGLKILYMPYLTNEFPFYDLLNHENEEKLFDVGVEDFLSLISYSEAIFTDSFHTAAFSGIFKKNYYVFDRTVRISMNSRLISLLDLFETQERFCDTKEKVTIEYLESLNEIDYSRSLTKLSCMIEESKEWLKKNIK